VRVVVSDDYVCAIFSVQPLPLPLDTVKASMPSGGFHAARQPWQLYLQEASRAAAGAQSALSTSSTSSDGSGLPAGAPAHTERAQRAFRRLAASGEHGWE
jgi:hypothetical protein